MDIQRILAYALVIIAVLFLVKKFFLPKKGKKVCGNDDKQCKCG